MVNPLICNLHLGRARLAACYIWSAHYCRRSGDRGVGVVHRIMHGIYHCELCGRAGLGISDRWWHVLCTGQDCATEAFTHMDVDHWLVQLPGAGVWSGIHRLYVGTNDSCYEEYEIRAGRWGLWLFAVSTGASIFLGEQTANEMRA